MDTQNGNQPQKTESQNIASVHAIGAAVMDAGSGRLSTSKHCAALVEEAVKALANERRGPRKRSRKDRWMPWDQVRRHYNDPNLSKDQLEAVVSKGFAKMSYATMRRHFKQTRGVPVGRPSASRAATV